MSVASWSFLTNHALVPLRIAGDPGARLRDISQQGNASGKFRTEDQQQQYDQPGLPEAPAGR